MKLDRNINVEGRGKYALLKLRDLARYQPDSITEPSPVLYAIQLLAEEGVIDWGEQGTEREFFVLRLRDKYAGPALDRYAAVASADDTEYAGEVAELASRAGHRSPFCKLPD